MTITILIFWKCSVSTTLTKLNSTWIVLGPLKSKLCISLLWATFQHTHRTNIYLQQFYFQTFWTRHWSMMFWLTAKICIFFKQTNKTLHQTFYSKMENFLHYGISWKKLNLWFLPSSTLFSLPPAQAWDLGTQSLPHSSFISHGPARWLQLCFVLHKKVLSCFYCWAQRLKFSKIYNCLGIGFLFMGH